MTDEGFEALDLWSKKLKSMMSITGSILKRYEGLDREKKSKDESPEDCAQK